MHKFGRNGGTPNEPLQDLRQKILQPLKNVIIRKLKCVKRETILNTPVESRSELKCDTRDLERSISHLGEIVEVPLNVPCCPHVIPPL